MNSEIKKTIAGVVAVFIILMAYFGSYLPMRKSMAFIDTMKLLDEKTKDGTPKIKTVDDLEQAFSTSLDHPSPIGQEELVRSVANTISNSLRGVQDPAAINKLVNYSEKYYKSIIERGRGMSFGQDIYILGMMNEIAFLKTSDKKYLEAAKKYFKESQILGPKRPQGLYGLIDVYRFEGDVDSFKKVAEQILSQWPTDEKVAEIINQALGGSSDSKKQ